jgi:SAM-dependent methyltransferase
MSTMDFDQVAAAWGRWSPQFERGSRPISERLVQFARIGPGSTVLDLGTGIGEPAITAAKAVAPGGRVVGIDVSPGMISLARERAHREGIANADFVAADAAAYSGDQRFDAIVSRWGLMFLPDLDASLAHYRGCLRDGGRFAAATWGAPAEVPMISLPMAVASKRFGLPPAPLEGGPFALHDAAALRERFVACGYQPVEVQDVLAIFPFSSAEEYVAYIADIAPPFNGLLRQLDPAQAAALRKEVEEAAAARFAGAGDEIHFPNRVIVIGATSGA